MWPRSHTVVTLLNAQAFVVLSSEMAADQSGARGKETDPRLARRRREHASRSWDIEAPCSPGAPSAGKKHRPTTPPAPRSTTSMPTSCTRCAKYVQASGDEAFLRDFGAEMLVETARLWLDLGFYSAAKGGKFCINGVTGPDEYNAVVNNNAYTNLMARENLRYATEVVQSLRAKEPDAYNALAQKTVLEPLEVSAWTRAASTASLRTTAQKRLY